MQTYEGNSRTKLVASVIAIIVVAGIVLITDRLSSNTQATGNEASTTSQMASQPATTNNSSSAGANAASSATDSTYKDGTYSASSSYYVPHGSEQIDVSVTVKNGIVTDSSITNSEGDHDSARYQQDFASVYKSYVVGKKISGLQLNNISGASDTTQGFNDALQKIASQAHA